MSSLPGPLRSALRWLREVSQPCGFLLFSGLAGFPMRVPSEKGRDPFSPRRAGRRGLHPAPVRRNPETASRQVVDLCHSTADYQKMVLLSDAADCVYGASWLYGVWNLPRHFSIALAWYGKNPAIRETTDDIRVCAASSAGSDLTSWMTLRLRAA